MNALARIPFWGWYLFSVVFCYWLWNPFFSIGQLLITDVDMPYKALAVILTLIFGSIYIIEGHRTLNVFGLVLFIALFGCVFWIFAKFGLHSYQSVQWWGQWIAGLLLAIALQGGRVWRAFTGRLPVSVAVDDDTHHIQH